MRIVEICTNAMSGSVGRIARDICSKFYEEGHDVLLCYGRGVKPNEKYMSYRIDSRAEVYLHAVLSRVTDSDGMHSKKATLRLIKRLKLFNPDYIHIHCLHGYYINYELLFEYFKKTNVKVIWTFHDCWAFTGHCTYFTIKKCELWKKSCHNCMQKKEYPSSLIFDNSKINWANKKRIFTNLQNMTIITPSEWLKDLTKKSFFKNNVIKVVNNGIDTSVFKPTKSDFVKKYKLENKKIILGVASIWDKRKGLSDFLSLSKIIDDRFVIVLVGLSLKQIKNLPDNIIGINRTGNVKELAQIYTAADVLFNPTYEDNYPTVNLEAQACGTPVVTYATGGSPESVPKENVIKYKDFEKFISLVNENKFKILSQENSYKRMINSYMGLFV